MGSSAHSRHQGGGPFGASSARTGDHTLRACSSRGEKDFEAGIELKGGKRDYFSCIFRKTASLSILEDGYSCSVSLALAVFVVHLSRSTSIAFIRSARN